MAMVVVVIVAVVGEESIVNYVCRKRNTSIHYTKQRSHYLRKGQLLYVVYRNERICCIFFKMNFLRERSVVKRDGKN